MNIKTMTFVFMFMTTKEADFHSHPISASLRRRLRARLMGKETWALAPKRPEITKSESRDLRLLLGFILPIEHRDCIEFLPSRASLAFRGRATSVLEDAVGSLALDCEYNGINHHLRNPVDRAHPDSNDRMTVQLRLLGLFHFELDSLQARNNQISETDRPALH